MEQENIQKLRLKNYQSVCKRYNQNRQKYYDLETKQIEKIHHQVIEWKGYDHLNRRKSGASLSETLKLDYNTMSTETITNKIKYAFDLKNPKSSKIFRLTHNGLKSESYQKNSKATSLRDTFNTFNFNASSYVDVVSCILPSTGLDTWVYTLGALQKAMYIN